MGMSFGDRRGSRGEAYLPNVFSASNKIIHGPFRKRTELWSNEADLAGPTPYHRRRATK
jgi:hypothetical protein